ncbi:oligosaccharide flippase family protein [Paenibacillus lautus]|uniref:lipopolysaccharide biosynthesis protein n=1 Tax=Paenibacillus lautus TaxID=1401 RepID=UPI003D2C7288
MPKKKSTNKTTTIGNFFQNFGSQIMIMFITLLSGVLLARGLGADGRGKYIAITMWTNLLYWALSFGIYQTVLYYWKSHDKPKKVIFTTFLVYTLIACILAIIISELVIVPLITVDYDTELVVAARIYFVGIIYLAFSDVLMASLAGDEKFGYSNILRIAIPGVTTLLMLSLFLFGILDARSALYASFITSSSLFVINLIKILKLNYIGLKIDWPLMWKAFKYGAKSQGGDVAGMASNNSTQMILSVFLPPASLGLYSTAQSAISPLKTITSTIAITTQPKLTAEDIGKVHNRVTEIFRKSIILIGTSSIGLALVLPFLLPFVYGNEFEAAILPALVLLPNLLFNSLSNVLRNALNGAGMTFINTKSELIILVFTIISLYVFLDRWALLGAAIVTLLTSILRLAIFYYEYRKRMIQISYKAVIPTWSDAKGLYNVIRLQLNKLRGSVREYH